MTRLLCVLFFLSLNTNFCEGSSGGQKSGTIVLENELLRYVIASDGTNCNFVDKKSGAEYCIKKPLSKIAHIVKDGIKYEVSQVSYANGELVATFGNSDVKATLKVDIRPSYLTLKVKSINNDSVEQFIFIDVPLTCAGTADDIFPSCALPLNIKTRVFELPGPSSRLRAICYKKFGIVGAEVAIIGCPKDQLRYVLQQVVSAADGLPKSALGGPWALDANRMLTKGSYVMNFDGISIDKVDEWIDYVKKLGANQIDFHGIKSFRFGDCQLNPQLYPNGFADLKTVIARLHKANIFAGLHTYAWFIDKRCTWVTPVPDHRLASDAAFTLAQQLTEDANVIVSVESTENLPQPTTGFFIRNSITLRIEDELITYTGITKKSPYTFTGCQRGALGTKVSVHPKGAKAYHLKECFGYFVPDPETTLWDEVVARTADAFNLCDFDMVYLDAMDAADIFSGKDDNWHYEARFVFDLCKRIKKPALMEMSSFTPLLWDARSRVGAWDVSKLSHKKFIDIHQAQNEKYKRMFLPSNLGWFILMAWDETQTEFTFPDDVEYLLCKSLGSDSGLSFINADVTSNDPYLQRMSEKIRQYETLRHEGYFPQAVRGKIKVPGEEFKLEKNEAGQWQFRPMEYSKHKVESLDGGTNIWSVNNKFEPQPLKLRLEALCSAKPYDCPEAIELVNFNKTGEFVEPNTAPGIKAKIEISTEKVKDASGSGCFTAHNTNQGRKGSWVELYKKFPSLIDLSKHKAIGVWIYGDGKGEVLNFQLRNPEQFASVIGERYVIVDFTGWRYVELIEFDGERFENYQWPYANIVYDIYRQSYAIYSWHLTYTGVESIGLWYNDIPAGDSVKCYISPVKALPLVSIKLTKPSVTIDGKTVVFDVDLETGHYLEFYSADNCKLYDSKGHFVRDVTMQGDVPTLKTGSNQIKFDCGVTPKVSARAKVTIIGQSSTVVTKD